MLSMNKILVPTDLSQNSGRALEHARQFATVFAASIDLLYVWSPPALVAPESVIAGVGITEEPLLQWLGNSSRELLAKFVAEAQSAGVEVANAFCELGDPASVIIERAQTGGYDLVVLATHGRTGLSHALMGSVAEKVVRRAPCPILTIRTGT